MEARIARVEKDIDEMRKAIIVLARVEERIQTIFHRQSKIETRVNSIDERLRQISPTVRFGERVFWIMLVVVVGAFFNAYGG
jgi:hypothetical protein